MTPDARRTIQRAVLIGRVRWLFRYSGDAMRRELLDLYRRGAAYRNNPLFVTIWER